MSEIEKCGFIDISWLCDIWTEIKTISPGRRTILLACFVGAGTSISINHIGVIKEFSFLTDVLDSMGVGE